MNSEFVNYILYKIRSESKVYYYFYLFSMLFLYVSILVYSWYFISFTYIINYNNYFNLDGIIYNNYSLYKIIFVLFSLFNCYFYFSNEVRFKLLLNFKKIRNLSVKTGNVLNIFITIMLFVITLIFLKVIYYA